MLALFVLYVVVEVAALVAVGSALGVLWTVVLLIGGSLVGSLLVRSQGRRVLDGLQRASRGERSAGGAVADGALFAAGSVAMFVPGLVTTVIGLLLLIPPTRWLLRPAVMWAAARWLPQVATATRRMRPTVIDGEILDDSTRAPNASGSAPILEGQVIEADRFDPAAGDFRKPHR
ncbi:FxsA family protein [Rhodococcus sp. IEGM 1401]|uniref:FxsA family protein n=1 Tax=Rhodococcus cerastii TaxID=908616 RepID=A0ABU4D151_9NOCA|nr:MULTISPECIES: FxsA family protein [Rhodococcus]MCZ4560259.1 FxsA family protein [Rhodococcus sp. IEGM 1401]MDI9920386.1 FxsA family protein [Rhodococcus sp. IEGM 1372]MDI9924535.1 FxsA family protein [Rhodococcus sp. IEGM 1341]MDV6303444.1 FxsA family protein [Rhodococcus cerastii]MDV7988430.1 FxsA family protein [Rhodococcus sp. IEGM 1374]